MALKKRDEIKELIKSQVKIQQEIEIEVHNKAIKKIAALLEERFPKVYKSLEFEIVTLMKGNKCLQKKD